MNANEALKQKKNNQFKNPPGMRKLFDTCREKYRLHPKYIFTLPVTGYTFGLGQKTIN